MREVPVQHNPDYHDWLLRTHQGAPRRDPGDIECGGLPLRSEISRALNRLRNPTQAASIPDLDVHTVAYAQACLLTVHDAIRPRFLLEWDEEAIGRDTRVAWLNRRINTEQLGIRREQLDRRLRFRRAVGEVLRTFVHAGADCLQRFCQSQVSLSQCASELRTLRHLINDELKEIALDFAPGVGRPHAITTDWGWS